MVGRVVLEDKQIAHSVVDNVLLLHLLDTCKTLLLDVGLSTVEDDTPWHIIPEDVPPAVDARSQNIPCGGTHT